MSNDETVPLRKALIETGVIDMLATHAEATGAPTWDTKTLQEDFEVLGFAAPFVVVRRRSDGVKGSLEFRHSPRVYFNFQED